MAAVVTTVEIAKTTTIYVGGDVCVCRRSFYFNEKTKKEKKILTNSKKRCGRILRKKTDSIFETIYALMVVVGCLCKQPVCVCVSRINSGNSQKY